MLEIIFQIIFYSLILVVLICLFWIFKILFYTTEGINYIFPVRIVIFCLIIFLGGTFSYGFYLWLESSEIMQPFPILTIEKPDSLSNFPPEPEFLAVGNRYFSGPWFTENSYQGQSGIWIILCDNDIIGLGEFTSEKKEFSSEEKQCFTKECSDPHYAVLPIFEQEESRIINYIVNNFNLNCNFYE